MRTRLLALISAFAFAAVFTACGSNDSSSEPEKLDFNNISIADRTPVDAAEETIQSEAALSDTVTPLGHETGLGIRLPSDYALNDGWSCYSDSVYKNAVWVQDAQVYETSEDLKSAIGNLSDKIKEMNIGEFKAYVAENPDDFYGASSNYFIDFGKKIGKYEGMRILVSNNDKDIAATQRDIIMQMIQSVTAS